MEFLSHEMGDIQESHGSCGVDNPASGQRTTFGRPGRSLTMIVWGFGYLVTKNPHKHDGSTSAANLRGNTEKEVTVAKPTGALTAKPCACNRRGTTRETLTRGEELAGIWGRSRSSGS